MSENQSTPSGPSEDVDLGQFFHLLRSGFNSVFKSFLGIFVFVRRNSIWLAGLIVVGLAAGYAIQKATPPSLGMEAVVIPNMESKNYLVGVVQELQSNLKAGDSALLRDLGVEPQDVEGFSIEVEPAVEKEAITNQEIKYLQTLQEFGPAVNVSEIVRAELLDNTPIEYRIRFRFSNPGAGPQVARKIMAYINSNDYFNALAETFRDNARTRIANNDSLMRQTDLLIEDYRENRLREQAPAETNRLVLDGEQDINIAALLDLKKELVRDSEQRKMDLAKVQNGVTVLHLSKPHRYPKTFLGNWMILMPVILVAAYLLFWFVRYLNSKAKEYELG